MHKRCKDALKVTCVVALTCAMSPVTAFAQSEAPAQDRGDASAAASSAATDATVETDVDSSKLQKTDVSKLAKVSKDAASTVKDYIADRADEVTGDKSASDDGSVDLAKKVAKTSEKRADNFQQMQKDANINITDAKTSVSVSKVTESGSTVKVKAYEQTVFYYDDLADGVGGQDVAIFGTDHTVTVDTSGKDATIKADAYDEDDLNGIDTTGKSPSSTDAGAKASTDSKTEPNGSASASAPTLKSAAQSVASAVSSLVAPQKAYAASVKYDSNYNAQKAIAYADKYWTNYNKKYHNFNPDGGDCANFVSQCMKAGKLNQKKSGSNAWFYSSSGNYSSSWTYCPSMVQALKSRGKYYWISKQKLTTKSAAKKIYPGSPVIYNSANSESSTGSYYHAVICTGYNSAGTPVISAHNNDRYHVPFTYAGNACATIQLTPTAQGNNAKTTISTNMNSGAKANGPFDWRIEDKKYAVITAYTGKSAKVTVPKTMISGKKKLKVVAIDANAFKGNKHVKTVTLPKTVTRIGSYAFKGCTKLTAVTGATGVTAIESYAFDGCKKLKDIASLGNAKTIGKYSFRSCKKLSKLPAWDKVTTIGSYAFKNCDALKSVDGFAKLKTLGEGSFYGSGALKKVAVESAGLKTIGDKAFWKTKQLKAVRFMSTKLAKVGDWAFYTDDKLNSIKFKSKLLNVKNIGYSSFTLTGSHPKVYVPKKAQKAYEKALLKHGLVNFKLYNY